MKLDKPGKLLVIFWIITVGSGMLLDRWHERLFLPPPEERQAEDVMVDVFGDIKTVVARYLWFKMDLFHEMLDEEGVAAERQTEVLPLLRMVSLLDPSMTDAFDQIAWDLFVGHKKPDDALRILDEGIRRNPKDARLRFRKGVILFKLKEFTEAAEAARPVGSLTEDEFEQLNGYRIVYWSSKEIGDLEVCRETLVKLRELRPLDPVWIREKAYLESQGIE